MSKNHLRITREVCLTLALVLALLFLAASAANAGAQTSLSVGNAVKHAVLQPGSLTHNLSFYGDTLKHMKQLVILPEPNAEALLVLGGLVGLGVWRLRRRSANTSTSR